MKNKGLGQPANVTEARENISMLIQMYPGMYQMTADYRMAREVIDNHKPRKKKK